MKDPRGYPQGRERIYLTPVHMDLHGGRRGFFVEKCGASYMLGFYDFDLGNEHASAIDEKSYDAFVRGAKANAKEFGETCGNSICEKALELWEIRKTG